ncbi:MAG: hypothetical protein J7J61_07135 [Candidatus Hydrothermae bacterium]|nr:hypothetical protein [Candidatus Hydrothermae bacterium]
MEKVVKVKACCWICRHFAINLNKGEEECELGHKIGDFNWNYVCEDFEVWEVLKPKEVIE